MPYQVDLTLLLGSILEAEVAESVKGLVAVGLVSPHRLIEVKLAHFIGKLHLHFLLLVDILAHICINLSRMCLHLIWSIYILDHASRAHRRYQVTARIGILDLLLLLLLLLQLLLLLLHLLLLIISTHYLFLLNVCENNLRKFVILKCFD